MDGGAAAGLGAWVWGKSVWGGGGAGCEWARTGGEREGRRGWAALQIFVLVCGAVKRTDLRSGAGAGVEGDGVREDEREGEDDACV